MTVRKFLKLFRPNVSQTKEVFVQTMIGGNWHPIPREEVLDPDMDVSSELLGLKVMSFHIQENNLYINAR